MSTPTFADLEGRVPPLAALAVAVVAVSTSAILIRWSEAPSLVKAFYRVAFTTGLLLPWAAKRHRADLQRIRSRDLLVASAAGVALALHFASWFESLSWTSVAASVTIVQAQPLFVAVGAWALLDERFSGRMAVGILVALAGMALLSFGGLLNGLFSGFLSGLFGGLPGGASEAKTGVTAGARPLYGNALALVGAVMMAAYVLAGRSLRQRIALVPYVVVVYTVCAVVLLVLAVWRGHPLLGYPTREWVLFLGMAVGPGLFGHTVVNWALAHLESSVVSVSLLGEPVGSTLLALALLGEVPTTTTVLGGLVVLGGIYLTASDRATADDSSNTEGERGPKTAN